ncbi:acetate kinase [Enterobacteriaceae endosymbiont of Macroplea appendiculata]|uniref:acetate kinase n=1 Tax=Enterobacteriaceae endosymbiont of Macroplea appendiculata TaxID=2675790 RepID=UPI001B3ABF52|nr:acetate kinase [Enterobacteriaceae endosymbiont of Macroplea appendiculata]
MEVRVMKLILVINCGSSSLKFSIINMITNKNILYGIAENFCKNAYITWKFNKKKKKVNFDDHIDHELALNYLINHILFKQYNNIFNAIQAVGHRIVHGGEKFLYPVIINNNVMQAIQQAAIFAPLHNPIQLTGIKNIIKLLPHLQNKQVAVFDTSFHQTMPKKSYLYAIPLKFYTKYKIRRYGAHGISHQFVTQQVSNLLNIPLKMFNGITCHLGNGSSITAIYQGKSIDTSMGLTPLEGLVMGTRCGNIDPAIIFYMNKKLNINIDDISDILMNKSGMLGLSELTSDFRYLEKQYYNNKQIKISLDIFIQNLSKYIASYSILLNNKIHALVFTGGIGANSVLIRDKTIKKLKILNMRINPILNKQTILGKTGMIHQINNSIPIVVIPTNEELIIAQNTAKLCNI